MPLYEVTYKIKHIRIFNVPDESYIHSIMNEDNDVEIIDIVKHMEE